MKLKNNYNSPNNNEWNVNLRKITILFSILTLFSATISLLTHNMVPAVTPLLMGITMFLFGLKEFITYMKYGKESIHLYLTIIYVVIFIFDLIAAFSQIQAALR